MWCNGWTRNDKKCLYGLTCEIQTKMGHGGSEARAKGTGLKTLAAKEDPFELDSSLALQGDIRGAT